MNWRASQKKVKKPILWKGQKNPHQPEGVVRGMFLEFLMELNCETQDLAVSRVRVNEESFSRTSWSITTGKNPGQN
ncbi:MAG: hypothetical protein CMK53_07855 [Proteobacteria bacterium]|nr:hypothetical protein [Pseudomonadota bacterium]MBI13212.1 hypothetical protein [Deltaproteobacteria bacterium]